MQVGVDVLCMHTNFCGCGLFGFGDIATFKNRDIATFKNRDIATFKNRDIAIFKFLAKFSFQTMDSMVGKNLLIRISSKIPYK